MEQQFENFLRLFYQHKHTGVDSSTLPITQISGTVILVNGSATITDSRIKGTSQIFTQSQDSHTFSGFPVNILGANCSVGFASIFGGGVVGSSDPVNYLIIF